MNLDCRIIQLDDVSEILEYENKKILETIPDEYERGIAKWNSKWRQESLEHYSQLGWSFLARDRDLIDENTNQSVLVGYFTAQPLLFLDGQTQSLWVEHISFSSLQVRDQLTELAYKLSREKHFQKVFFPNLNGILNSIHSFKPEPWNSQVYSVKTTK